MKPQAKKTKHILTDAGYNTVSYLGLVTPEADYKISLLLNQVLAIKLTSNEPVVPVTQTENKVRFSRFTSVSEFSDLGYQLISNKSNVKTFSKKYTNIDYILIISGSITKEIEKRTVSVLRGTKEITAVFVLETESHINSNIVLQML